MLAREQLDQLLDHRSGGAIASVPADAEARCRRSRHQSRDIGIHDIDRSSAGLPRSQSPSAAIRPELLDVFTEEGAVLQHHLEAVIFGRDCGCR
jgi:hypothetical protein